MTTKCMFSAIVWLIQLKIHSYSTYFISSIFQLLSDWQARTVFYRSFWHRLILIFSNVFRINSKHFRWSFSFDWNIIYCFLFFRVDQIRKFGSQNCPWACYKIVCGTCQKWKYVFVPHVGLRKFMSNGSNWVFT